MKNDHINWSKNEFLTYLLLFCANADINQSAQELYYIKDNINKSDYQAINLVFNNDTDYQCITRIQEYVKHHDYTNDQLNGLFSEIKTLFNIDGDYDVMEQHLLNVLQSLLK